MTTNNPTPVELSDEQLSSLETQSQNKSLDYAEVDELLSRIPALCQTVRALRANEWDAKRVIQWLDNPDRVPPSQAFTAGVERQIAYRFERLRELVDVQAERDTALREQLAAMERQRNEALDQCTELQSRLVQVEQERDDLIAANISKLLTDIKERLTPDEGREFQSLLMAATRGWVDEVTVRSEVDRGLLEAFKDLPKRKKK